MCPWEGTHGSNAHPNPLAARPTGRFYRPLTRHTAVLLRHVSDESPHFRPKLSVAPSVPVASTSWFYFVRKGGDSLICATISGLSVAVHSPIFTITARFMSLSGRGCDGLRDSGPHARFRREISQCPWAVWWRALGVFLAPAEAKPLLSK